VCAPKLESDCTMPQQVAANLDTILLHLTLAYCMHILIKTVLLMCRGQFSFHSVADWSRPRDLQLNFTPHSDTSAPPPWLQALSADDLGADAAPETDTALLKQAFRSMVRRRRGRCREWLQERLADCGDGPGALRRFPIAAASIFGRKWSFL
jgi:hypothetical protein